jgi:hypothetical protein
MDANVWFHVVGFVSVCALCVGVVTGFVSLALSWKINRDQDREMSRLHLEIAHQQERAANAERELLELQERTAPHGWTQSQMDMIASRLAPVVEKTPLEVVTPEHEFPTTEVAERYTEQLTSVLAKIGWPFTVSHIPALSAPRFGMAVQLTASQDPTFNGAYFSVFGALRDAGKDHGQ